MLRRARLCGLLALAIAAAPAAQAQRPTSKPGQPAGAAQTDKPPARLAMTPAVACASITAYQQYEALPEPAVTKDDKLILYYEPLNFATEKVDGKFQCHLVQDVRVRRRGRKEVLWSRDKLLDVKQESAHPHFTMYLYNRLALKDLAPGDYDLDLILHDVVAGDPPAQQVVRFSVKPSPPPKAEKADDSAPEGGSKPKPDRKPRP